MIIRHKTYFSTNVKIHNNSKKSYSKQNFDKFHLNFIKSEHKTDD